MANPSMLDLTVALIGREGGYVNRAADRGGPTKYGIKLLTLGAWRGHPVTAEDVQALTQDEAAQIYGELYWKQYGVDRIYAAGLLLLAEFMFDWVVTSGGVGPKKLQRVIGAVDDGKIGEATVYYLKKYLANVSEVRVLNALVDERIRTYIRVCKGDATQLENLEGWFNRVQGFRR
jgi:type VI secretion system secreted protein VgrG